VSKSGFNAEKIILGTEPCLISHLIARARAGMKYLFPTLVLVAYTTKLIHNAYEWFNISQNYLYLPTSKIAWTSFHSLVLLSLCSKVSNSSSSSS
jgi:hypothetical protein